MAESRLCPECSFPIPAGSPEGLCPKCLLKAGMHSQPEAIGTVAPSSQEAEPGAPQDPSLAPTIKSPAPGSGFVAPTIEQLAPLFPQLQILELLGQGGMGAVYKARQPALDRLVAVKILPQEIGQDPSFAERFQREARALAKLDHSCIVGVHDFGKTDGLYYFLMEFVDGINLRQALQSKSLSPQDALAVVPQICDALQFAHDEGIVHRDIKPENILIDKKGRVKIADFGLAKLLGADAGDHSLTATHQVMGTLRYMAPEQLEGAREVDHRADIYSLGVVFYELLTGELPFGRFAPPSKKVQIDVRLDEVVLRALEKEPALRYQQASELRTGVERAVAGKDAESPPNRSRDLEERIAQQLRQDKIQAIRLYRQETGASLAVAKDAVETIGKLYGIEPDARRRRVRSVGQIAVICAGLAYIGWLLSADDAQGNGGPPHAIPLFWKIVVLTVSCTVAIVWLIAILIAERSRSDRKSNAAWQAFTAWVLRDPERWWTIAASAALYASSFFLPAAYISVDTKDLQMHGGAMTGLGAFNFCYAAGKTVWLANPIL